MVRMPNKAETPARVQELQRQVRELFASANQSARSAQSTANTAQNKAVTAQATADGAQTTASGALGVAQGASYDAANASTAAQTAQQQAQAAQQAAAAKTKTTWSTAVPDNTANPGTTEGDVWYVTNGTGGNATAQYRWSASNSQWTLTPIDGAALRNVIADTVKAGAVDGQTITGATIRSAATGKRIELLNTRLDVYSDATASAASIEGIIYSSSAYAGLQLKANGPNGAGTCNIYTPVNTSLTGSWTGTVKVSASIPSGLATADFVVRRVFAGQSSATDVPKLPIIETDSNGTTGTTAAGTRFFGNRFSWINPYGGDVVDIVKPAYADSNGVVPLSKVIVTAGDFQLLDGTSITADSKWLSPTVATGSGYSVNTLRYRKIGNRVEWTGQLNRNANMASQTNVITVPAAYAPSVPSGGTTRIFSATGTAGTAFRFNFNTNGQIDIRDIANGTTTYAILDGITYLTD